MTQVWTIPCHSISSALNVLKRAKFLVPVFKPVTTGEFTAKDSFHLGDNILISNLILGVDSLLTNIPLDETTEICANKLLKEFGTM